MTVIGNSDNCPGLFPDLVSVGSGRLADVAERCGKLNVYNLPDTARSATRCWLGPCACLR